MSRRNSRCSLKYGRSVRRDASIPSSRGAGRVGIVAAPRQWQRQKDRPGEPEAKLLPCPSAHERHQLAGLRQGRIRRGQVEVQARGLRRQRQAHDGVGHVVHGHQVDRLGAAGRHQRQPPVQVEAQGKV